MITYALLILALTTTQTMSQRDQRTITTLKYSKNPVIPTVINGQAANYSQIPYMVSIKEPIKRIGRYRLWSNLCGGSIIGKKKVLTAAHCFETNKFYYFYHPFILRIVAGNLSTDLIDAGQSHNHYNTQWRKINHVALHSNFHFPDDDIALVIVDKEWDFSDNVDFINVARRNIDYPSVCSTAGFGKLGFGRTDKVSSVLLLGRINLLTKNQCSNLWEMNMNRFVCTTSAFSDVGNGDSGGPLTCKNTKDPSERYGRPLLVGVVSGKNFDKTTLFTRVSAYSNWIDRNYATSLQIHLQYLITFMFSIFPYLIT